MGLDREACASLEGPYPCSFGDENILDVHASNGQIFIGGSNLVRHGGGISVNRGISNGGENRDLGLSDVYLDSVLRYGEEEGEDKWIEDIIALRYMYWGTRGIMKRENTRGKMSSLNTIRKRVVKYWQRLNASRTRLSRDVALHELLKIKNDQEMKCMSSVNVKGVKGAMQMNMNSRRLDEV